MRTAALVAVLVSVVVVAAFAQDVTTIVGSGSNLPRPLYDAWVRAFNQRNAKAQARYLPLGTAESIKQISNGSGDFGGGEVPLTADVLAGSRTKLMVLPVALVAVVPIYNLPGVSENLHFSGNVLADIYLGKVRNWNDPELTSLNPGVKLPAQPIQVVHRSEGKGANYILSDFLSKTSPAFRQKVGRSASPNWPLGKSANRNEDMAEEVKNTAGAIGYVELNYASSGLSVGAVQNAAGRFVKASRQTVENACDAAIRSGVRDLQMSLTNVPGQESYPISSFTYVYLPVNPPDKVRGHVVTSFIAFALGDDGQSMAADANYGVLPEPVIKKARSQLSLLTTGGPAKN